MWLFLSEGQAEGPALSWLRLVAAGRGAAQASSCVPGANCGTPGGGRSPGLSRPGVPG